MQNKAFEWTNVFVHFTKPLYATERFYSCRSKDSGMNIEATFFQSRHGSQISLLGRLFFFTFSKQMAG